MNGVVRGEHERDRPVARHVAQFGERVRVLMQLFDVATAKFRPASGIVPEPFSQIPSWRNLLGPFVDRRVRFFRPRGQKRSTSTRSPSSAEGCS